jgi:phage-related protein
LASRERAGEASHSGTPCSGAKKVSDEKGEGESPYRIEDYLTEVGLIEELTSAVKRVVAWQISQLMKTRRVTKSQMAKRMRTSRAALDRLLLAQCQVENLRLVIRRSQTPPPPPRLAVRLRYQGWIAHWYQLWYYSPMAAKKIEVLFFASEAGAVPVREWLRSLPREDRKKIGDDILEIEQGWPVGMPVCRPLGHGLYEVRTRLKDQAARVIFAIERDEMVLLHGFIKKSQTTPQPDLELARKRLQAFRRREG